jgi:hypothetical protein
VEENIGILQQRRIEAKVISAFYTSLAKEFGVERSRVLVGEVIRGLAVEKGRELRRMNPAGDMKALVDLWQKLGEGGALDVEFIQQSHDCLCLRINRCGYADAYTEMGIGTELGSILSCSRDEALLKGFSDEITIERSRTIMEGANYCELIYRVKK